MLVIASASACSTRDDDPIAEFLPFLLLSNLLNQIGFYGTMQQSTANPLSRGTLTTESPDTVVALGADAHYSKASIDAAGNFSLRLNKDMVYIIVFLKGTNTVGAYRVSGVGSSMDGVPTHTAVQDINAGTVAANGSGQVLAATDFSLDSFLQQAGVSQVANLNAGAEASAALNQHLNLDLDANGVLDPEENKRLYISTNYTYASLADADSSLWNTMQNSFLDPTHESFLTSGVSSESLFFSFPTSLHSGSSAQVTYPVPANCANTTPNPKTITRSSNTGGVADGSGSTTLAYEFVLAMDAAWTGAGCSLVGTTSLPDGSYSMSIDGTTYTWDNMTRRRFSSSDQVLVPLVKFNVSGDSISSVDYKFVVKDSSNTFRDATDDEVVYVFGNSAFQNAGGIICRDSVGGSPFVFDCSFPTTSAAGTVSTCRTDNGSLNASPAGVSWSSLKDCNVYSRDLFGTFVQYTMTR